MALRRLVSPFSSVAEQHRVMWPSDQHPFRRLRAAIDREIAPSSRVLEIGCGRHATELVRLAGKVAARSGIDPEPFTDPPPGIVLFNGMAERIDGIADSSIDLVFSKAVMEHIQDPAAALGEIARVLRPGGRYVFLTPNKYDYASIISNMIPNSWHPRIVRLTSGRNEADTFPVFYRANTRRDIERLAADANLRVLVFEYLGQYPAYLQFNRILFWIGSMYELMIERSQLTKGLKGWIMCTLVKS